MMLCSKGMKYTWEIWIYIYYVIKYCHMQIHCSITRRHPYFELDLNSLSIWLLANRKVSNIGTIFHQTCWHFSALFDFSSPGITYSNCGFHFMICSLTSPIYQPFCASNWLLQIYLFIFPPFKAMLIIRGLMTCVNVSNILLS